MTGCLPGRVLFASCVADERHKRKYPEAPRRQMTDVWKQLVRSELKRQGIDQVTAAGHLGVHKTAMTKMFQAESSALVDGLCELLRIPPPMQEVAPDRDELEGEVRGLSHDERAKVLKFIRDILH